MEPEFRSPCPISCTLDLLGDKWTLLIVRDLFCGKSYFKEFVASPERIATNILANRLERLLANGVIEKIRSPMNDKREAYRLTAKGRELRPTLEAMMQWGLANIKGTEVRMQPIGEETE